MILLGSTGSIGVNTLEIVRRFSLSVDVLVAGNNIELLNYQIGVHNPRVVVVANADDIPRVNHSDVYAGEEAILEAIESSSSTKVINALVGFVGLKPTLKAIECGKTVALANKESLVVAGAFIDSSKIIPIDSEHFGLSYLLDRSKKPTKMSITASGGAFRDVSPQKAEKATLQDALKHPNWSMGQRITIDSATMTNKLYELIEARWLFGEEIEYDAIIERSSTIHAFVGFADGSTTAHLAKANMQLPIAYALLGKVDEPIVGSVDLLSLNALEIESIETRKYPIWRLKDELLKEPRAGIIINAANEVAVDKFVEAQIPFGDISKLVLETYEHYSTLPETIDDIFLIDKEIREMMR